VFIRDLIGQALISVSSAAAETLHIFVVGVFEDGFNDLRELE